MKRMMWIQRKRRQELEKNAYKNIDIRGKVKEKIRIKVREMRRDKREENKDK